jgi:xanthine dehydrogenase YagT iron-sulfur-binding subunit
MGGTALSKNPIATRSQPLFQHFFVTHRAVSRLIERAVLPQGRGAKLLLLLLMEHKADSSTEASSNSFPDSDTVSSRRDFIGRLAAISAGLTVAVPFVGSPAAEAIRRDRLDPADQLDRSGSLDCALDVNGKKVKLSIDTRTTLLDALRDRLGLMGTKKGCDHGACGACTVHVNGARVLSCLTLAVMAQNKKITTIEGLAVNDELHPVQASFIACDGFQCGYCTPGQIMSAVGCIEEGHTGSDTEIREFMSGNLCRCGAYPNIVEAIKVAAAKMKGGVS